MSELPTRLANIDRPQPMAMVLLDENSIKLPGSNPHRHGVVLVAVGWVARIAGAARQPLFGRGKLSGASWCGRRRQMGPCGMDPVAQIPPVRGPGWRASSDKCPDLDL